MKVPMEIAKKIMEYESAQKKADETYEEVKKWFEENTDAEGFCLPFIADRPTGEYQGEDEYCDQTVLGEDWYKGKYYHKIIGSKKWAGYSFEI